MTNPKPNEIVTLLQREGSVSDAHAHRPIFADPFKVEGRMPWIALPKLETPASDRLNLRWQGVERLPKVRSGKRFQGNFRLSPAWYSLSAFSARGSSFPASASAAICRSHLSAMYSSNQRLNAASSSGENSRTHFSTFSTALTKQQYVVSADLKRPSPCTTE